MSFQSILGEYARRGGKKAVLLLSPETATFLDYSDITDTNIISAVDQLVKSLKIAGLWQRAVAIYPMVGGTDEAHSWNLKNPSKHRMDFQGSWIHSATGAKPDGTTAYGDTWINLNEDVPQYSFCGAYYSREDISTPDQYNFFGVKATPGNVEFQSYFNNRLYGIAAEVNAAISLLSIDRYDKLMAMSCYHHNKFNLYRDGVSVASSTVERFRYFPSSDPANVRKLVMAACRNANASISNFCPAECAFGWFSFGLTAAQMDDLNDIITIFQTALNRAV